MPAESLSTARRFILGRQGLWPGRRWQGPEGVDQAVRYIGSVQFDPLDVVGRSHDLALWGRIVGYQRGDLDDALYKKRTLFESGGAVCIRPIGELPYVRFAIQRKVAEKRWKRFASGHTAVIEKVTRDLENRGPLGSGDYKGVAEKRIQNYRAGTESGLALYYLWLNGDIMIAFRRQGEKVFDLTSRLFPRVALDVSTRDAEDHLILQTLRELGLATRSDWLRHAWSGIGRITLRDEWRDRTDRWEKEGIFQEIEVDGLKGRQCLLSEAASDLETIRSREIPSTWRPRSTTTDEEVVFLAPLETVSARGRSTQLFDFEYLWEVYKPASKRRWGYYTLPVLWGDRLCARIELRADRVNSSLQVLGFWPEEPTIRRDPNFSIALARALRRLADFNGASVVGLSGLRSSLMQGRVAAAYKQAGGHTTSGSAAPASTTSTASRGKGPSSARRR
ncbi:MAG: crosslink repair DNA glycosylase YcaQ family protein [Thermoplasmata archaeon]